MIICFQCEPDIKKQLDDLIRTGHYRDYSEALSCALRNEMLMQERFSKGGGALVLDEPHIATARRGPAAHTAQTTPSRPNGAAVSQLFARVAVSSPPPQYADLPADTCEPNQEIPIDKWFFGQYNRLLPAKANCRALAHLLQAHPEGVAIEETASYIAREASDLRLYLSGLDSRYALNRDELLSTAFPDGSGKSTLRYASQFFCNSSAQGSLSGLLADLKLIGRSPAQKSLVLITEPGWRFATQANPVLDDAQEKPAARFSDEEVDFMLEHIRRSVAVEDFAYRAILSALRDGANTPETIDEALSKYLPRDSNRRISAAFRASQRSGAVSRMSDLHLLDRIRKGLRVVYVLTKRGEQFLNNRVDTH